MSKSDVPLPIHSFTEAYLYVRVTPCRDCGTGRLVADVAALQYDRDRGALTVPVTCQVCGWSGVFRFDTSRVDPHETALEAFSELPATAGSSTVPALNAADRCSRVIEVAGWLTLFAMLQDEARVLMEESRMARDRTTARRLHLQASACLG